MSESTLTELDQKDATRSIARKTVVAGLAGIFVELYENVIYGFLAGTLAIVFFPNDTPATALLLTFVAFGIPFFMRPLGAAIGGHWGDKLGRRTVLIVLILLMSGSTGLIGLLPSAAAIGIAAPVLLVCLRFIQGFSMGAEAGIGNSYLGESAPTGKRGQVVSYANAATFAAMLFGIAIATGMTAALGAETMIAWGWRIPFLLALPMGIAALLVRLHADESPEFVKIETSGIVMSTPFLEAMKSRQARRGMIMTIALPLFNSSGYFVLFTFMPSFMTNYMHFSQIEGLVCTGAGLLVGFFTVLLAGRMSDHFGRRPMLMGSAALMIVLGLPCYYLLTRGSFALALLGTVTMAVVFTGTNGVVQTALLELFPTRIRTVAYGFGYNVGTAIFGGAAPAVITALITITGNTWVPAFYLIITSLGAVVAAFIAKETAFKPLPA